MHSKKQQPLNSNNLFSHWWVLLVLKNQKERFSTIFCPGCCAYLFIYWAYYFPKMENEGKHFRKGSLRLLYSLALFRVWFVKLYTPLPATVFYVMSLVKRRFRSLYPGHPSWSAFFLHQRGLRPHKANWICAHTHSPQTALTNCKWSLMSRLQAPPRFASTIPPPAISFYAHRAANN